MKLKKSFFKRTSKDSAGFTLIELMIVIGLISILSIIALTAVNPVAQFQKSTDARKKSDLSQIQKALETYYQDNNKYPPVGSKDSYNNLIKNADSDEKGINWGESWQPYMNILPKSSDNTTYVYYADETNGRQSYYLYASLSRGADDSQACNDDGSACDSVQINGLSDTACGGVCNYGVTSANVNP
jgi:type II secretion system protein G